MFEKWMEVIIEAQSEEQILTCFSVLSGFIVIIPVTAVVALVIDAFLKNKKISKSQISSLFIFPVCLKTLLHLIAFKTTFYSDLYFLFIYLFGHHCIKN